VTPFSLVYVNILLFFLHGRTTLLYSVDEVASSYETVLSVYQTTLLLIPKEPSRMSEFGILYSDGQKVHGAVW